MEAVLTRPEQKYVFDHKLSQEEIQERVDNYDYDPKYADPDYFDENEPAQPIYDVFGNPTEATIRALYEDEHDIGETFETSEDLFAEWDKIWQEVNDSERWGKLENVTNLSEILSVQ